VDDNRRVVGDLNSGDCASTDGDAEAAEAGRGAPKENPFAYALAIRNGLNGINSCRLVRRSVTVSPDRRKIIVRNLGLWPTLI